jgi:amphi-Trp domain-containing protein
LTLALTRDIMTEEVLFKFEQKMSKTEIAEHLDRISEKLKSGEAVKLSSDTEIELNPSQQPDFEIKVEREGDEISLELELEWNEGEEKSSLEVG